MRITKVPIKGYPWISLIFVMFWASKLVRGSYNVSISFMTLINYSSRPPSPPSPLAQAFSRGRAQKNGFFIVLFHLDTNTVMMYFIPCYCVDGLSIQSSLPTGSIYPVGSRAQRTNQS